MIEQIINVGFVGFFVILVYAFLRIAFYKNKYEEHRGGYITSQEWTLKPKPIKGLEQPSKPWPIVIENMPEYYIKEINNKIVIVMGEENA